MLISHRIGGGSKHNCIHNYDFMANIFAMKHCGIALALLGRGAGTGKCRVSLPSSSINEQFSNVVSYFVSYFIWNNRNISTYFLTIKNSLCRLVF